MRPGSRGGIASSWTGFDFGRVDSEGRVHLGDLPLQDVIITVAVHQNVPVEFLFRPTLLPD
jgi:hypothetical protein